MTKDEKNAARDQAVEQGKLEQRLDDIGDDNARLKLSIEKKDAILGQIAVQEYALNFTPQVLVLSKDKTNEVFFQNHGKTNVIMGLPTCNGAMAIPPENREPALLTPATEMSVSIPESIESSIVESSALLTGHGVPFECEATITTADNKKYSIRYTWTFVVTDGKISRSYVVPRAIEASE